MRRSLVRQQHAALRFTSFNVRARNSYTYSGILRPPCAQVALASSAAPTKVAEKTSAIPKSDGKPMSVRDKRDLALDHRHNIQGIVPDLSTTRPLPLHVPDPPHDLAWPSSRSLNPTNWSFKYLFALGKGYLNLFKTGLKNVWKNWKTMNQIQTRVGTKKLSELHACATYIGHPRITYNELELILRTKKDVKKLAPFALIFAICGEFTPLVILALGSGVLPGTCIIPKLQAQDLQAALKRHDNWSSEIATLMRERDLGFKTLLEGHRKEREIEAEKTADSQNKRPHVPNPIYRTEEIQTRIACLEAYRLGFLPLSRAKDPLTWSSSPWLWWAIRKYKQTHREVYTAAIAIEREGGWSKKSPQDMWEWGMKYGMYQLLTYARAAHARGENPVSDAMKEKLLPAFQGETRYLIDSAFDGWRLTGDKQYILDLGSPDAKLQRAAIEKSSKS